MASLGLKGIGVSRGIAIGQACLLQHDQLKVREYLIPSGQLDREVERFNQALLVAKEQLDEVRQKIPVTAPVDIASFIDSNLLMVKDRALSTDVVELICKRGCNAEWALKLQRDAMVAVFEEMDDSYLRTRKDDVDHVVNRIQKILLDNGEQVPADKNRLKGCVVISDDLSPADAVTMQDEGVVAFVTEHGGPTSHATILARSLGIPAVVGVHNVLRYLRQGEQLIVDGNNGVVIVNPDKLGLRQYKNLRAEARRHFVELDKLKEQPAVSRDGLAISLQANIELPEDLAAMKKVAAKGVGLYRTEYLFMNRKQLPDEDEQFAVYLKVLESLAGAPLTIRTLDSGADKGLAGNHRAGMQGGFAVNPALGLRAIRLCLRDTSLFLPQIKAILRASARGAVSMMIPMLTSLQEVQQALELLDQAKYELDRDGLAYNKSMPVGGMIEVPAAALSADVFARHLDFLSIGTNDLVQYTLAADRLDNTVNYLYQPTHPAVLRLIDMTIKAGRKAGIPVAMCGEMAGETRYTRLLLGLGLREFSMQPAMVPEVKSIVQESDVDLLSKKIQKIFRLPSAVEIENFVDRLNNEY